MQFYLMMESQAGSLNIIFLSCIKDTSYSVVSYV